MLWSVLHKAGQHSSYESLISLCTYSYWTILVMLAWSCFVNTLMLSLKHWKVDFWVQVSNSFESLKNHHVRTPDLSSFDSFNAYFIGTKWKIMWCTPSSSDTRQYQHNLCCHMWTYKRTWENCRHFHQTHKLLLLSRLLRCQRDEVCPRHNLATWCSAQCSHLWHHLTGYHEKLLLWCDWLPYIQLRDKQVPKSGFHTGW